MEKLGKKFWLALIIFSLCGQIAWTIENMLFNVFIQEEFNATLNDIALMVSLSAVVATITTLLIGALSDKIGKRKLFICVGYILWGISILGFAFLKLDTMEKHASSLVAAATLGVSLTILFDCIMTFFGSSANDSCFNAWVTDISNNTNRGKIEGINSAMPLIAVLVVFGGNMLIEKNANHWTILFLAIGIIVLLVGILGFFLIKDMPLEKSDLPYFKNIFYGFKKQTFKENKLLYIILIGFAIFCTSVQIFMPYLIIYFTSTLGLDNYVLIFAPAIVIAAAFTFFFGRIIDKYGFFKTSLITFAIYGLGLIVLTMFTNIVFVFIGTMLMMSGYLSLTACFNSEIRNNTPADKVGFFQGIRIVMQVLIPMLIGPWIGSLLSGTGGDGFLGIVGDGYTPARWIFLGAVILSLFILIFIFLFKKSTKKSAN